MAQQTRKRKNGSLPFNKQNLQILIIGLAVIVLGYIAMSQGPVDSVWSMTVAPILLLIAFFGIIPYAIMYGHKKKDKE